MKDTEKDKPTRLARTIPISINLLVVSDDEIRLCLIPLFWMVLDSRKWAETLLDWHRRECLDAAKHGEYETALSFRQVADGIFDWLGTGHGCLHHPLLAARLEMTPHVVDATTLVSYVKCIVNAGASAEDDLVDAILLLDADGGALRTTAKVLANHSGPAVEAELVDEDAMRGCAAPFLAFLRGEESRGMVHKGESKCH